MVKKVQNLKLKVQSSRSASSPKAKSMADLMKSAKTSFAALRKGDIVEGTITKLKPEILVDVGGKTEAVVLEKDRKILQTILSTISVGDKVGVQVLNPESDMGNPVVSLRKFIDDRVWGKFLKLYKTQQALEVIVSGITRGGFLVETLDGILGFLPNSQSSFLETEQNYVGKKIKVIVLEADRTVRKIIFSQKATVSEVDFDKAVKNLKVEQKIDTTITNLTPFGIVSSVQTGENFLEGFVHISEVSWENISSLPEKFKLGEKITALIIGFDSKARRVNLSIKRLIPDPFLEKLEKLPIDKKIKATVLKITSGGVVFELEEGVSGVIRKDKIPPNMSFKIGDSVDVVVSQIDKRKRRAILVPVLLEKPIGYR